MVLRLLGILLALLALHFGYQIAAPAINNTLLEGKMKDIVKNRGLREEREMIRDTMAFAQDKNIPLKKSQLNVRLENGRATIAAAYEVDAKVLFYTKHYRFYPASSPSASLQPRVHGVHAR